jgi:hypothetical protein
MTESFGHVCCGQGDQMCFRKIHPKLCPNHFFVKINTLLLPWKKCPKIGLFVKVKKRPKVKIHPMGENSPNPVTLDVGECNV